METHSLLILVVRKRREKEEEKRTNRILLGKKKKEIKKGKKETGAVAGQVGRPETGRVRVKRDVLELTKIRH